MAVVLGLLLGVGMLLLLSPLMWPATELAPQRKIVVQAAAREAAALPCGDECSTSKAEVLVFVDQARLVGDATQPTVFANRIKVSMVKGSDGWRVANIRAL